MDKPIGTRRLRLRDASERDLTALRHLLADTPRALTCFPFSGAPAVAAVEEMLRIAIRYADRRLLIIEEKKGRRAVGLLDLRLHHPWSGAVFIELLLLAPEARGHGYGREACEACHDWASEVRGYRESHAGVLAEDGEARAFWRALGYRETGESHADDAGRSFLVFVRALS